MRIDTKDIGVTTIAHQGQKVILKPLDRLQGRREIGVSILIKDKHGEGPFHIKDLFNGQERTLSLQIGEEVLSANAHLFMLHE